MAAPFDKGNFCSDSELGLGRLPFVREREAKLGALRQTIDAAIKRGGSHSNADVESAVGMWLDKLFAEQKP